MTYSPSTDGAPDPGEVVWTWVPFEERDGRGKDRPVLVVAAERGGTYLAVQLTSKSHQGNAEFVPIGSGKWDSAGRPSWVNIDRVFRLHPAGMRRETAGLPAAASPPSRPGCGSGTAGADASVDRRQPATPRRGRDVSRLDDGAAGPALGAGAGVQADRGGAGQVERLGAAVDRHPDRLVGARDDVVGQAVRLGPEQPGRRQVQDAVGARRVQIEFGGAGGGQHRQTRPRTARRAARTRSAARATGRWNRLPADARIAFGLNASTESPARMTPSAPAASASRMTVPALPGSLARTSTATSFGEPASTSATVVCGCAQRTTMPCGVTASDSAAAALSVTWVTSTLAANAARTSPTCLAAAASVMNSSSTSPGCSLA